MRKQAKQRKQQLLADVQAPASEVDELRIHVERCHKHLAEKRNLLKEAEQMAIKQHAAHYAQAKRLITRAEQAEQRSRNNFWMGIGIGTLLTLMVWSCINLAW